MPDKSIVFGWNNRQNKDKGISLYPISFYGTDDKEKHKTREKWVHFVKLKHAHWKPKKYSAVCSKHILDEDYPVNVF